jgi:leader peptidase (prepilin peptidase) / N-methyltransferase
MGMGDVKMSFVLGLYLGFLGWGELVLGFFAAFLLGALVGLALIALKLRSRKDAVPFGPFLAAGTVLAALWGDPILRWYSGT